MTYDLALSITRLCLVVAGVTITATITLGLVYQIIDVLLGVYRRATTKKESKK